MKTMHSHAQLPSPLVPSIGSFNHAAKWTSFLFKGATRTRTGFFLSGWHMVGCLMPKTAFEGFVGDLRRGFP
eukprot:c42263_g1_i1 orf=2-214(-)